MHDVEDLVFSRRKVCFVRNLYFFVQIYPVITVPARPTHITIKLECGTKPAFQNCSKPMYVWSAREIIPYPEEKNISTFPSIMNSPKQQKVPNTYKQTEIHLHPELDNETPLFPDIFWRVFCPLLNLLKYFTCSTFRAINVEVFWIIWQTLIMQFQHLCCSII